MQSKGAIRFVAILLILACLWQLSFTLVSALQGGRAKKAAENQVALTEQRRTRLIIWTLSARMPSVPSPTLS